MGKIPPENAVEGATIETPQPFLHSPSSSMVGLENHLGKVQEETLCRFEVEKLESAPLAPTWPS